MPVCTETTTLLPALGRSTFSPTAGQTIAAIFGSKLSVRLTDAPDALSKRHRSPLATPKNERPSDNGKRSPDTVGRFWVTFRGAKEGDSNHQSTRLWILPSSVTSCSPETNRRLPSSQTNVCGSTSPGRSTISRDVPTRPRNTLNLPYCSPSRTPMKAKEDPSRDHRK